MQNTQETASAAVKKAEVLLSRKVYDAVMEDSNWRYRDIEGQLMTLLDAVITEPKQRESAKDLARQLVMRAVGNSHESMAKNAATLVYDFNHRNIASSDEKYPFYHWRSGSMVENAAMVAPVEPDFSSRFDNVVEG